MQTLSAVIVDDEPVAIRRLERLVNGCEGVTVAATAGTAATALPAIAAASPDVVFLDIEIPGCDGLSLASQLRQAAPTSAIIFVTAFDRFALDAFDVAATDYLLKPVDPSRLREALERVREKRGTRLAADRAAELEELIERLRSAPPHCGSAGRYLWLDAQNGRERIDVADVLWVEAERDYVRIYTERKSYFVRGRIGDLQQRLSGGDVVRVHRSALVNRRAIMRIEPFGGRGYRLILKNGAAVTASRRLRASVHDLMRRSHSAENQEN